jgi:aldehyde dehydrogenase (NAD+)
MTVKGVLVASEANETGVLAGDDRMLIDGELQHAAGGAAFEVIHPASEQVVGRAADGTVEDMGRAGRRGATGLRRRQTGRPTWSSASTA